MGKKLASTFGNMLVVLFGVTLLASASVAYVYTLTKEPINQARLNKQAAAIREVIPGTFDNDPMADKWSKESEGGRVLEFYPAKKNGETVGTAVKTYTQKGFSGEIWLMVGFLPDGKVTGYTVLEHKETPGLGSKMDVWFVKGGKGDITGRIPAENPLKVKQDQGEVDAITAATISSRAFLDAVNRAAAALQGDATSYDSTSGATTSENTESN
ncbi:MAG: RnfABCDGE type electron transport complex subunit G [Culturomica sp.]|jgi:electron transport complex protein RnfG|nr:RnfABCDGE type electron transport complex subunit G [Culturomica sp.]